LGDNAELAMIELVDFNELLLGASKEKTPGKAKATRRRGGKKKATETANAEVKAEATDKGEAKAE
ncbi:MAG: 50S ribosomal protein L17, partial [Bacteroidia bacterium]|nr:50S ribosomal protein L17 [Bacteroidia bacterium]